jgi:hypothetical protein
MTGQIAHKGDKAPLQAGQRWHVERTNAWHNALNRLKGCCERRESVIDAFFDLADTHHHAPRPDPPRMGHPPVGQPTGTTTMALTVTAVMSPQGRRLRGR